QGGQHAEEDRAGDDQPPIGVSGTEGHGTGHQPDEPTDDGGQRTPPAPDVHPENPAHQDVDGPDPEGQDDEVTHPEFDSDGGGGGGGQQISQSFRDRPADRV